MVVKQALRIVFWSALLFVLQLIVFLIFQFSPIDKGDYEGFYFVFVKCNIIAYVIAYAFFAWRLKITLLWEFLLLTLVPILLVVYILIGNETIKVRALDGIYFLAFSLICYWLRNQGVPAKSLAVALFSALVLWSYKPLTNTIYYRFIETGVDVSSQPGLRNFEVTGRNGKAVRPFAMRNKVVFINVWNRSCGSCIKKMSLMRDLQNYFKRDTNIVVMSLYGALNVNETSEWFYDEYAHRFDTLQVNFAFANKDMFASLDDRLFPQYYIVDKTARVRKFDNLSFDKSTDYSVYERISESLLENK